MPVESTRLRYWIVATIAIVASLAIWCEPALAQCAMCKEALANSAEAAASARQFNLGILVLLAPPVAMFAGIFVMVYRSGKAGGQR
ncbi:MAG TPA: hypothetical protein VGV87_09130 [Blastocatellia bacterium]|jgi:hypothetical protein|nr:hypothetical protein [Blastocatellia bacterium]